MDTIRMVTAMVMLTVRRMSSSEVGRGTIIMPIMAAMQETRIRSLNAVRTLSRFPDLISSRIRPISNCTLCSTITSNAGCARRKDGVRAESFSNSAADASGGGRSSGGRAFHFAHRETHALQDGARAVGASVALLRVEVQRLLELARRFREHGLP